MSQLELAATATSCCRNLRWPLETGNRGGSWVVRAWGGCERRIGGKGKEEPWSVKDKPSRIGNVQFGSVSVQYM